MKRIQQLTPLMVLLTIFCAPAIGAISVEELVGEAVARELRATGTVKLVHMDKPSLDLVPKGFLGEKYTDEITAFGPNLVVEALYLYPKPAKASQGGWTDAERTAIYNAMRSLSTLAGIEYYSASRQRMRTFYETSTIVSSPESSVALPDPVVLSPPEQSTLYAIQKDLTFGENRYRYTYFAETGGIAFTQENLTSMKYGVFPILGKNKLRTTVLVLDAEGSLVMYAVSAARVFKVPGLENKIRNSFSNRADALYGWFSNRADEVFKAAEEK